MHKYLTLFAASALCMSAAAHAGDTDTTKQNDRSPEAQLERALDGWQVSGEPVDCLRQSEIRSTTIIPRTAIIYEAGTTKYLNRPTSGAQSLRTGSVLVTDTRSSQLCGIDIVRLYESGSRMMTGTIGLGKFIPYRKVEKQEMPAMQDPPVNAPVNTPEPAPAAPQE